jgi:hypothetical protein
MSLCAGPRPFNSLHTIAVKCLIGQAILAIEILNMIYWHLNGHCADAKVYGTLSDCDCARG